MHFACEGIVCVFNSLFSFVIMFHLRNFLNDLINFKIMYMIVILSIQLSSSSVVKYDMNLHRLIRIKRQEGHSGPKPLTIWWRAIKLVSSLV